MTSINHWPQGCIQEVVDEWWQPTDETEPKPGTLVRAIIPYLHERPYRLTPIGRAHPTDHNQATVRIEPFTLGIRNNDRRLPIAGLPLHPGESFLMNRGKARPALVVARPCTEIPEVHRKEQADYQCKERIWLAPYYSVSQSGRVGFSPPFVERIKQGEYPQLFWDNLPLSQSNAGSVLRFDHLIAVPKASQRWYAKTGFKLTEEAWQLLSDWIHQLMNDEFPATSLLPDFLTEIRG